MITQPTKQELLSAALNLRNDKQLATLIDGYACYINDMVLTGATKKQVVGYVNQHKAITGFSGYIANIVRDAD